MDTSKLNDVLNWNQLQSVTEIQSSPIQAMTDLLKQGVEFKWTKECEGDFQHSRDVSLWNLLLVYPISLRDLMCIVMLLILDLVMFLSKKAESLLRLLIN